MFSAARRHPHRGEQRADRGARRGTVVALAASGAALLIAAGAVAPVIDPATAEAARQARIAAAKYVGSQRLDMAQAAAAVERRDGFDAEASPARMAQQLIGDGTQYDWARLVLYDGGWEITDDKVLAIAQWMRAENSPGSWWLRNNPLNNGFGTFAGNFMSGYPSLIVAAQKCAEAIQRISGYQVIEDALTANSTRDQVRAAIIASSWATGHYGGGAHWGGGSPEAVSAPASAWGQ